MKSIAFFAIALVLAACASSDSDIIDSRSLGCESGQDVSIMAGLDNGTLREDGTDNRFELVVEVSNNSHGEVTVTAIRAEQVNRDTSRYRVDSGYRKYDQLIPEGKDFAFQLPMSGRMQFVDPSTMSRDSGNPVEIAVTVTLSNGDSYRCPFVFGTR